MRFLAIATTTAVLIATTAGAAFYRSDAQQDLAKALAGHVPGKTVECIDPKFASGPQIIGHDTLLYRSGGTIWKNNVIGPCPSLEEGVTMVNDIYGGQLCHNDKFRTLSPGETIPSAYCRLGAFTEYKPVKR